MRNVLLVPLFISFLLLFGCSNANSAAKMDESNVDQKLILDNGFSKAEKDAAKSMHAHILDVNQLIEELDLLIAELQKNDELLEAIEIMETASDEANSILAKIKLINTNNNSLTNYISQYEEALLSYITGLNMQIEGIENLDSKKSTEGFRQTENAKNTLKQFKLEIKQ